MIIGTIRIRGRGNTGFEAPGGMITEFEPPPAPWIRPLRGALTPRRISDSEAKDAEDLRSWLREKMGDAWDRMAMDRGNEPGRRVLLVDADEELQKLPWELLSLESGKPLAPLTIIHQGVAAPGARVSRAGLDVVYWAPQLDDPYVSEVLTGLQDYCARAGVAVSSEWSERRIDTARALVVIGHGELVRSAGGDELVLRGADRTWVLNHELGRLGYDVDLVLNSVCHAGTVAYGSVFAGFAGVTGPTGLVAPEAMVAFNRTLLDRVRAGRPLALAFDDAQRAMDVGQAPRPENRPWRMRCVVAPRESARWKPVMSFQSSLEVGPERALGTRESSSFAGRGDVVERLAEALGQHPRVSLVGPSGGGKSSLVEAGLLRRLTPGEIRIFRAPGQRPTSTPSRYVVPTWAKAVEFARGGEHRLLVVDGIEAIPKAEIDALTSDDRSTGGASAKLLLCGVVRAPDCAVIELRNPTAADLQEVILAASDGERTLTRTESKVCRDLTQERDPRALWLLQMHRLAHYVEDAGSGVARQARARLDRIRTANPPAGFVKRVRRTLMGFTLEQSASLGRLRALEPGALWRLYSAGALGLTEARDELGAMVITPIHPAVTRVLIDEVRPPVVRTAWDLEIHPRARRGVVMDLRHTGHITALAADAEVLRTALLEEEELGGIRLGVHSAGFQLLSDHALEASVARDRMEAIARLLFRRASACDADSSYCCGIAEGEYQAWLTPLLKIGAVGTAVATAGKQARDAVPGTLPPPETPDSSDDSPVEVTPESSAEAVQLVGHRRYVDATPALQQRPAVPRVIMMQIGLSEASRDFWADTYSLRRVAEAHIPALQSTWEGLPKRERVILSDHLALERDLGYRLIIAPPTDVTLEKLQDWIVTVTADLAQRNTPARIGVAYGENVACVRPEAWRNQGARWFFARDLVDDARDAADRAQNRDDTGPVVCYTRAAATALRIRHRLPEIDGGSHCILDREEMERQVVSDIRDKLGSKAQATNRSSARHVLSRIDLGRMSSGSVPARRVFSARHGPFIDDSLRAAQSGGTLNAVLEATLACFVLLLLMFALDPAVAREFPLWLFVLLAAGSAAIGKGFGTFNEWAHTAFLRYRILPEQLYRPHFAPEFAEVMMRACDRVRSALVHAQEAAGMKGGGDAKRAILTAGSWRALRQELGVFANLWHVYLLRARRGPAPGGGRRRRGSEFDRFAAATCAFGVVLYGVGTAVLLLGLSLGLGALGLATPSDTTIRWVIAGALLFGALFNVIFFTRLAGIDWSPLSDRGSEIDRTLGAFRWARLQRVLVPANHAAVLTLLVTLGFVAAGHEGVSTALVLTSVLGGVAAASASWHHSRAASRDLLTALERHLKHLRSGGAGIAPPLSNLDAPLAALSMIAMHNGLPGRAADRFVGILAGTGRTLRPGANGTEGASYYTVDQFGHAIFHGGRNLRGWDGIHWAWQLYDWPEDGEWGRLVSGHIARLMRLASRDIIIDLDCYVLDRSRESTRGGGPAVRHSRLRLESIELDRDHPSGGYTATIIPLEEAT